MSLLDWPILRQLSPDFLATVRIALVFGPTGNEALMILGDHKVYGIGKNTYHCLGIVDDGAPLPRSNSILSGADVVELIRGGDACKIFVIARLQNGEIFQWGSIPSKSNRQDQMIPERVEFGFGLRIGVKIKAVACGSSHCMVMSDDGRIFTWGKDDKGQLGLDRLDGEFFVGSDTPREVGGAIQSKVATEISCGAEFSIVILEDGKVFSWGCNRYGQLGINMKNPISTEPVAVSLPENVVLEKIACGPSYVLALSKDHKLYVWGSNKCSQLGVPAPKKGLCYGMPLECEGNLRFVDICATNVCDLSVAECESGEIYMWGKKSTGKIIKKPTITPCESIHQVFAFHASPNIMPKQLRHKLKAKRRSMTMLKTLESEFGNPENSDLTILVDNREIYVHQAVLKMRSTYFKSMLSRWLDENQRVVTIQEKSFSALEAYLKYLYTDELEVNLELAVELWQLGDEYADENFKLLCEQSIKRDLTADRVAELFALTRKQATCQDLNKFCLKYALKHADKVIDSEGFKNWDAETTKAFTIKLVKMKRKDHT